MDVLEQLICARKGLVEYKEKHEGDKPYATELDCIIQNIVDAVHAYCVERNQNEIRRCGNCKYADRFPCHCDLWEEDHVTSDNCAGFIKSEVSQ